MKRYNLLDEHDQVLGDVWALDEVDALEKGLILYPEAVSAELYVREEQ